MIAFEKHYLGSPMNKTFSCFIIFTMLDVIRITQLAEPEACLVWWADVHRHTDAFHQALISAVTIELSAHWQIHFFKNVTLRSISFLWFLKSKATATKICK